MATHLYSPLERFQPCSLFEEEREKVGDISSSQVIRQVEVEQMRAYDELRELSVERTAESWR